MTTTTARPSMHEPMTVDYALDQITDPDRLREVAGLFWEAWHAQKELDTHAEPVLRNDPDACAVCVAYLDDMEYRKPCADYQRWQRALDAGRDAL